MFVASPPENNYENSEQPPVVWMFSGQGSQYYQMGKGFYDHHPTFRSWMQRLDQVVVEYSGQSIIDILFDEKNSKAQAFSRVRYTHPALFMVQYSLAQTLIAENYRGPDYLLGASLGEFVAAVIANVFDAESMLHDLMVQASLMETYCDSGGMLAVIDHPSVYHENEMIRNHSELAGTIFENSFVISGKARDLSEISEFLKRREILHQLLPVSVAFHSSYLDGAKTPFIKAFASRIFHSPSIPIVSCVGQSFESGSGEFSDRCSPTYSANYCWNIIRQPIAFQQTFAAFHKHCPQAIYLDLSPSGTMATFVKYNLPGNSSTRSVPLMTPYQNDPSSIEKVKAQFSMLAH